MVGLCAMSRTTKQDGIHLSGIQMVGMLGIQAAFKYQTIWCPISFQTVKYQTNLVFRSPLYLNFLCAIAVQTFFFIFFKSCELN